MFATPAFAQAAGAPAGGLLNSMLVPMLLVFAIMYFFMIRPQQKKMKEHQAMLGALRKGRCENSRHRQAGGHLPGAR